ncbi:sensor histidine kinase [Sphingomonas canadensis]|uniref:histidine kinase n=1 Tax=Sphingomonas canadensis TaxID=1219257 RepID=A0ABW3HEA8_9SPHN|nr:ATP-binding protein [Sphingomonas canadensis]MCW3837707.1 ATP-binding protein [Sphingomonas canadensis]
MGFDRNFTLGLLWRLALLQLLLVLFAWAVVTPGLGAVRIAAAALAAGAGWLLWRHVYRTNLEVAQFVEALEHGDTQVHFDRGAGSGFGRIGAAFEGAIRRLREERRAAGDERNFLEALVNDVPVALLTVTGEGRIELANKAARRLFTEHDGVRAQDFAVYGATFANRLELDAPVREEVLILNLGGRAKRAIVRSAALTRLGERARVVIVQPVQETLNAVEMAAQTDLVRVLTHEILNSLTPVTSLAATANTLLAQVDDLAADGGRIADARLAVSTLERRAEGLARFINSYRKVASEPRIDRRRFEAAPFAAEMARLFAAEFPGVALDVTLRPEGFLVDADPDLMAQALLNLLRNAAEAAAAHAPAPRVALTLARMANGETLVAVEDNGPGVPADLRRDIFLPFFTTRAKGTGVGLNLVRQIAVAHGGAVEVKDAEAGGARFELLV